MILSVQKENLFEHDFPTKSCHASTVLPLPSGTVLVAWFGGTAEGKDDVDIFVTRRESGVWQRPKRISADRDLPHWNPVLFRKENGQIILFFKVGKKIAHWQTFFALSDDDGRTWTKPSELVPGDTSGGRGPVKNKPIRLSNGTVLCPASTEQPDWLAFMDLSDDDCRTFQKQMILPTKKLPGKKQIPMIQPTLWESGNGKVHALLRTSRGHAYRSDSEDFGITWCKAYPTNVKNPNSGLDLTCLPDGRLFLLSNPCARNWGDRAPLVLFESTDNGESFHEILTLEKRKSHDDEFSYPAITNVGNRLYLCYTRQRQCIAYAEIEIQ